MIRRVFSLFSLSVCAAFVALPQAQGNLKWQVRMESGLGQVTDVHWTGKLAVAVTRRGHLYSSPDGAQWTLRDSNTQGGSYHTLTRSATGKVYASGSRWLAQSDDGIKWKRAPSPNDIKFAVGMGDKMLGISMDYMVFTTADDSVWARQAADSIPGATKNIPVAAAWSGKLAVVVGVQDDKVAYALAGSDGVAWRGGRIQDFPRFGGVVWAKDRFFAMAKGVFASSTDGLVWGRIPVDTGLYQYDVAWTGKRFVAVGQVGQESKMRLSEDGAVWTEVALPDPTAIYTALEWTGSRLIMAGSKADTIRILTSDEDAVGMRPRPSPGNGFAYAVEGGWLVARLTGNDRLVRACLRNTSGLMLRSVDSDARGALRMPLPGVARGVYVLELEGMKGRRSAPILLTR